MIGEDKWVYVLFQAPNRCRLKLSVGLCLLLTAMFSGEAQATLLLRYTFDDQVDPTDNSGSLVGYDGDLQGTATFAPAPSGGSGNALLLDGNPSPDSVVIPVGSESAFDIGDGDFSLFARFNTSFFSNGAFNRWLIMKQGLGASEAYGLAIKQDTGRVLLHLADGTQGEGVATTIGLNDGETHEVWGIREGECLCLYVDGSLHASATLIDGFGSTNNNRPMVIGGRTIGSGLDDFVGLMDEVRVYNEAVAPCTVPEPTSICLCMVALGFRARTRMRKTSAA